MMKRVYVCLLYGTLGFCVLAAQQSPPDAAPQKSALYALAPTVFAAFPDYGGMPQDILTQTLDAITSNPAAHQYPTTSINESAIDAFFGASGIDVNTLDKSVLGYIKSFYFYFEYVARREKAAQLLTLLDEQGLSYEDLLGQPKGWGDLIKALKLSQEKWQATVPSQDAWDEVDAAIGKTFLVENKDFTNFWQQLTQTSFWTAIPITQTDLQNSLFWQDFVKSQIVNTFALDFTLINAKAGISQQLFNYIPLLEISYYLPDYQHNISQKELVELSLLLDEHSRDRLLPELGDWSGFKLSDGSYDYDQIYAAAKDFQSPSDPPTFYQQLLKISQATSNADGSPDFGEQTTLQAPLRHEIRLSGMLLTLLTMLHDLFQGDKLPTTMTVLTGSKAQPLPSILPFGLEDGVILSEFNDISQDLTGLAQQNPSTSTSSQGDQAGTDTDNEPVTQSGIVGWAKSFGKKVEKESKEVVSKGVASVKDVGKVLADEGQALYYGGGIYHVSNLFLPRGDQTSSKEAAQKARIFQDALNHDTESFKKDVTDMVSNATKLALTANPEALGLTAIGPTLAGLGQLFNDPALSKDWDGLVDNLADAVGSAVGAAVGDASEVVFIAADVVTAIAMSMSIATIPDDFKNDPAFMQIWTQLGHDIVSSFLEAVVITGEGLKDTIVDLIKASGYLIKMLTDLIIDIMPLVIVSVGGALTGGALFVADPNIYGQVHTFGEDHRRTISQIVTVGLMVGAIVLTGGAAAPADAFALGLTGAAVAGVGATLVMGSFMVAGGAQEDKQIADAKGEIAKFLKDFSAWTVNQKAIAASTEIALTNEVKSQLTAGVANAQIGLGFNENYLRDTASQFACQAAYALGNYQSQLVAYDSKINNLVGEVGRFYGYTTFTSSPPLPWQLPWIDLNPSQGLVLYEPSRGVFAQEIAQLPMTIDTDEKGNPISRFWFLQSLTKDFDLKPTVVFDVLIKPIYLLGNYYVGIGIGGVPLDREMIQNEKIGNPDRYHRAKMFVVAKDGTSTQPFIGVYEHETPNDKKPDGWLFKNTWSGSFAPGVWYRMRGELAGSQLKVWIVPNSLCTASRPNEPPTATIEVTPLSAPDDLPPIPCLPTQAQSKPSTVVPLSIIYSGASIEFKICEPGEKYRPVDPDKPITNQHTEEIREKAEFGVYKALMAPAFWPKTMIPILFYEFIKGNFIYMKTDAGMQTQAFQADDYVVFASHITSPTEKFIDVGLAPIGKLNNPVVISLVTGTSFNQTWTAVAQAGDIWPSYKKAQHATLSDDIIKAIEQARTKYVAKTAQLSYQFGLFNLTIAAEDVARGQYVYKTQVTLSDGKLYDDYMLLAQLDPQSNAIKSIGFAYDSKNNLINGLFSLVNYQVYRPDQQKPIIALTSNVLDNYQTKIGNKLRDDLRNKLGGVWVGLIPDALKARSQVKQVATPPLQDTAPDVTQPDISNQAQNQAPSTPGANVTVPVPPVSLNDQQAAAADPDPDAF